MNICFKDKTMKKRKSSYRKDVTTIDHYSYLLSEEAIERLIALLDENGVSHQLSFEKGVRKQLGLTIAYSKNRLDFGAFRNPDLDMDTEFIELDAEDYVHVPVEEIKLVSVLDSDNRPIDVLIINDPFFIQEHQRIIEEHDGEWSQGDYIPYIKINDVAQYAGVYDTDAPRELEGSGSLTFTHKRFMRFAEYYI